MVSFWRQGYVAVRGNRPGQDCAGRQAICARRHNALFDLIFFGSVLCLVVPADGQQTTGSCTIVGFCVRSPNYPNAYPKESACEISGIPLVPLTVTGFKVLPPHANGCSHNNRPHLLVYTTLDSTQYSTMEYCGESGPSGVITGAPVHCPHAQPAPSLSCMHIISLTAPELSRCRLDVLVGWPVAATA